jgi:hypothetical protein
MHTGLATAEWLNAATLYGCVCVCVCVCVYTLQGGKEQAEGENAGINAYINTKSKTKSKKGSLTHVILRLRARCHQYQ